MNNNQKTKDRGRGEKFRTKIDQRNLHARQDLSWALEVVQ